MQIPSNCIVQSFKLRYVLGWTIFTFEWVGCLIIYGLPCPVGHYPCKDSHPLRGGSSASLTDLDSCVGHRRCENSPKYRIAFRPLTLSVVARAWFANFLDANTAALARHSLLRTCRLSVDRGKSFGFSPALVSTSAKKPICPLAVAGSAAQHLDLIVPIVVLSRLPSSGPITLNLHDLRQGVKVWYIFKKNSKCIEFNTYVDCVTSITFLHHHRQYVI